MGGLFGRLSCEPQPHQGGVQVALPLSAGQVALPLSAGQLVSNSNFRKENRMYSFAQNVAQWTCETFSVSPATGVLVGVGTLLVGIVAVALAASLVATAWENR